MYNGQQHREINKYKYNGKELQDELDLNWYDCGARNSDPAVIPFTTIDPRAEEYYSQSPYAFAANNPVYYIDINGEGVEKNEWIPVVNNDGSTSYIAEKDDNAKTLASQFGLDKNVANDLYDTMEDGVISGQSAKDLTGSEVLKLDLRSNRFTMQRFLDQFFFARSHMTTSSTETGLWETTDYFSNTGANNSDKDRGREISGYGNLRIGGSNVRVHFQIPIYRFELTRTTSIKYPAHINNMTRNRNGRYFSKAQQSSLEYYGHHPKTNNKFRLNPVNIWMDSKNFNKVYDYMNKIYPIYTYKEKLIKNFKN